MEEDKMEKALAERLVPHFREWKWWYFVLFLVIASMVSNTLYETVWRQPPLRRRVSSVILELPRRLNCHLRNVVRLRWTSNAGGKSDVSHSGTENWLHVNVGAKRMLWLIDTPLYPSESHYPSFCVLVTRGGHGTVVMYPGNIHPVIKVPGAADYTVVSRGPERSPLVELLLRPKAGPSAGATTLPH